jgi:hypothetical protein
LSPKSLSSTGERSSRKRNLEASDVLQHLLVQRQVGDHLLQPGVLVFQLLQALHFGGYQAAVRLAPIVIGGRAEARFPADLRNRHTLIALLQNKGERTSSVYRGCTSQKGRPAHSSIKTTSTPWPTACTLAAVKSRTSRQLGSALGNSYRDRKADNRNCPGGFRSGTWTLQPYFTDDCAALIASRRRSFSLAILPTNSFDVLPTVVIPKLPRIF